MEQQRPKKGESGYNIFMQRMREYKIKFFYALTELLKRYTLGKDGFPFEIDLANNEDWIWFRWWFPGMTDQTGAAIFRKYRVPRHPMIVWFLIYVELETHGLPEQGHDRLFCSLNEDDMGQRIPDQPRRGPVIPGSNDLEADRNVIRAQYSPEELTPEAQQFVDFINNFYNILQIPKEGEILAEFERFISPPPFPDPTQYAPAVLPLDKKTDTIERPSHRDESYDKFAKENARLRERFFRSLAEIIHNIPNEEKQGYIIAGDFIWFRLWSKNMLAIAFQGNSSYEMYRVPNHPMVRQFLVYVEDELRDTIYDQLYCSRNRLDIDIRHQSHEPTRNPIHPESELGDVYGDRARIRQNYTQEFLDFIAFYYRPYTLRSTKVADAVDTLKAVLLQDQDPANVGAGPVAGPVAGEEGVEDGGDGDDADNEPEQPPKKKQRVVALKKVTVPSFSDMGTTSGLGSARMPGPHPAIQWLVEDPNEVTVSPSPDMGTSSGLGSARMPSPRRSPARSPIPSPLPSPKVSPLRMPGPRLTTRPAWQWLSVDPNEPTVAPLPDMGTASGLGSFPEYPPHRPAYSPAHSPRLSPPRGPLESEHDFTRLTIPNLSGGIEVMPIAGAGSSTQLGYVPVGSSRISSPELPRHSPARSPGHSPARSPGHSPARSPGHSPARSPGHSPARSPGHRPARSPGHSPARSPGHSPARSPGHSPARSPGHSPAHSPRPSPQRDPLESEHDFTRLTIPNLLGGIEVMPIAGAGSSTQLGYVPVGSSRIPSPEFPRRSPVRSHLLSPIQSPPLVGITPAPRTVERSGDLGEDAGAVAGEDDGDDGPEPAPKKKRRVVDPSEATVAPLPDMGTASGLGSARMHSPRRSPALSPLPSPIQSPPLVGQQEIVDLGPEEVQQYFDVEGIVSDIREEVEPEGFNPAENVQLSPRLQQYLPSGNTTPVASPAASPDPPLSPGENQLLDEVIAGVNDLSDEEDVYGFGGIFDDQQQGQ